MNPNLLNIPPTEEDQPPQLPNNDFKSININNCDLTSGRLDRKWGENKAHILLYILTGVLGLSIILYFLLYVISISCTKSCDFEKDSVKTIFSAFNETVKVIIELIKAVIFSVCGYLFGTKDR